MCTLHRKRWIVVGAGPCGIGSVARLLDNDMEVTWIDPNFYCGRMGKFYANVPSNTLNGDLIRAFEISPALEFVGKQQMFRDAGERCMSDLSYSQCYDLGLFVDTLRASTEVLKKKTFSVTGIVTSALFVGVSESWQVYVKDTDGSVSLHEADAILYCCGSKPIEWMPGVTICNQQNAVERQNIISHKLDLMVDPVYVCKLLCSVEMKNAAWAVVGNSHSGLLVVKNLYEAGATNIINLYRSELRFMHYTDEGWRK